MSSALMDNLPEALKTVGTRPLFRLREQVPPLYLVGQTPNAFRRIGVITGGAFEGERLSGEVLSGGNDWQNVRPDSVHETRCAPSLENDGRRAGSDDLSGSALRPPAVMQALDRGETVDPTSYYFRLSGLFETGAPQYDWLNRIIVIGIGNRAPDGPIYNIFEVL